MTSRTRPAFLAQVASLLADNSTGAISEADLRSLFTDEADSLARVAFVKTDATTHNGATVAPTPVVLHTYTAPAGLFANVGDMLMCRYAGDILDTGGVSAYFGLTIDANNLITSGPYVPPTSGASYLIDVVYTRIDDDTIEHRILIAVQFYEYGGAPTIPDAITGDPDEAAHNALRDAVAEVATRGFVSAPKVNNDETSGYDFDAPIAFKVRGLSNTANGISIVQGGASGLFIPAA